jgi:hypothetical protein
MFKLHVRALALMATAGIMTMSMGPLAQASTTANQNVTLTVSNVVTITPDGAQPMAFGTYAVTTDNSGDTATLTMAPATGVKTASNLNGANFVAVAAQADGTSRGKFDITAAPNTALTASAAGTGDLDCTACAGGVPDIDLTSVTVDDTTPTTDGSGAVTVLVAATLTTIQSATQYESGVYTGTYTVTVNY